MTVITWDDVFRIWQSLHSLPANPIAPEHRGYARLLPSADVARGTVYRLSPNLPPELLRGSNPRDWPRPWIVMNHRDAEVLRRRWGPLRSWVDVDQEIADCAEQLFAERELRS